MKAGLLLAWLVVSGCAGASSAATMASPQPSPSEVVLPGVSTPMPQAAPPSAITEQGSGGCEGAGTTTPDEDYRIALRLIDEAGEHPSDEQLGRIIGLLRGAAEAGLVKAQQRYGSYVVGFWMTDEMFWPRDRATAVSALAMLRVAARAKPRTDQSWYMGLGKDPVELREAPLDRLPMVWVRLAIAEADRWERCHLSRGRSTQSR